MLWFLIIYAATSVIGLQYMANPTRNSNLLQIPLYSTASGQRTFKYRAVKIWNQLSTDLKEISFKEF